MRKLGKVKSALAITALTITAFGIATSVRSASSRAMNLREKRKGAFAFEYIIVLVLMVSVIIMGWNILGAAVMDKINQIDSTIRGVNPGEWNGGSN